MRVLLDVCVYIAAGYGLISMVLACFTRFWAQNSAFGGPLRLVVLFKNSENTAECLLRAVLGLRAVGSVADFEVVAVDENSTDRTRKVLKGFEAKMKAIESAEYDERPDAIHRALAGSPNPVSIVCDARGKADISRALSQICELLKRKTGLYIKERAPKG